MKEDLRIEICRTGDKISVRTIGSLGLAMRTLVEVIIQLRNKEKTASACNTDDLRGV